MADAAPARGGFRGGFGGEAGRGEGRGEGRGRGMLFIVIIDIEYH